MCIYIKSCLEKHLQVLEAREMSQQLKELAAFLEDQSSVHKGSSQTPEILVQEDLTPSSGLCQY